MKETTVQNKIKVECCNEDVRLFRNHVGSGINLFAVKSAINKIYDPELRKKVSIETAKGFTSFGFGKGSSDLIGIKKVKITSDMVGENVGIFFAVETKKPDHNTDKNRLENQTNFINTIKSLGGRAGFAQTTEEANDIINNKNKYKY